MEEKNELEMLMEQLNAEADKAIESIGEEAEAAAEAAAPAEEAMEEEEGSLSEEETEAEEPVGEFDPAESTVWNSEGEYIAAPEDPDAEPKQKPAGRKRRILAAVAALLILVTVGGLFLNGILKKDKNEVVMTVNGREIHKDEFEYYVYDMIAYYSQYYGADFFASDAAFQELKDYVADFLEEHYVIYTWAEENGYRITDETLAEAREMIESVKANYETEEDFQKVLADNHLTEDLYLRLISTDTVVTAFSNALNDGTSGLYSVSDAEAREAIESLGILGAKHILITSGTTEEEDLEKETLVFQLYDRLMAGENFDDLMKEYGEDPGMEQQPDGYTFGKGEMVQEFYDGTAALEIGQIGEPVVSDYGWHIILRVEPDLEEARLRALNDLINRGLDAQKEKAVTVINTDVLDAMKYQDYIPTASK